jgi:hypothetical protein
MRDIQEFSMEEWVIDPPKPSGSPSRPENLQRQAKTHSLFLFAAQILLIITS